MAIICIIIIVIFIVIIAVSMSVNQIAADPAWNANMTVGAADAPNHYIMYTDLLCPYCDVFSRVVQEHWDEFLAYLDENHIQFEIRLTDYLHESSGSSYSRAAAEGAYCAAREDKFWDYYHGAISALWQDYHSKGIGSNRDAKPITNLPDNYWLKIGQKAGLGDNFKNCLANHEAVAEVDSATARALQTAQGMPYFKFNRFTQAGFDDKWGWDYAKKYLDAGLGKQTN